MRNTEPGAPEGKFVTVAVVAPEVGKRNWPEL